MFLDRVPTVIASVEQTFWEMVFANENLKGGPGGAQSRGRTPGSNRARLKPASCRSSTSCRQKQPWPHASNRFFVAENPSAPGRPTAPALESGGRRTAAGPAPHADRSPTTSLEAISLQEAIDIAIRPPSGDPPSREKRGDQRTQREVRQESAPPHAVGARHDGALGLGADYGDATRRNFGGDFYNYGADSSSAIPSATAPPTAPITSVSWNHAMRSRRSKASVNR